MKIKPHNKKFAKNLSPGMAFKSPSGGLYIFASMRDYQAINVITGNLHTFQMDEQVFPLPNAVFIEDDSK